MTDYRAIAETETDALAPIRQALKKALQKNHIAAGEGADGAPVIRQGWHPYNMVTYADGNDGKFYDHAVDGTVANIATPDFEDGYEYRVIIEALSPSTPSVTLDLEIYKEADAAYTTPVAISNTLAAINQEIFKSDASFIAPRRATAGAFANIFTQQSNVSSPNQYLVGHNDVTVQKILRARFSFSAGNIDAGRIFLFRRLLPEA